jgi:hypothetical protein
LTQPGQLRYVPPLFDRNVNSIFFRRVKGSSSSSPYAPRSSWLHVPVRLFATTVAAFMTISPVVHTIRIHGIYDKDRSVLYGMGFLLAIQVVVTGICCAFYRCEFCFPSSLVSGSRLTSQKLYHCWRARDASLVRSIAGLVYIGSQPLSCTLLRYDDLASSILVIN